MSLPDQLGIAGFGWRAYVEGMVDPATGDPANYVYRSPAPPKAPPRGPTRHDRAAKDVPATELARPFRFAVPTFLLRLPAFVASAMHMAVSELCANAVEHGANPCGC